MLFPKLYLLVGGETAVLVALVPTSVCARVIGREATAGRQLALKLAVFKLRLVTSSHYQDNNYHYDNKQDKPSHCSDDDGDVGNWLFF